MSAGTKIGQLMAADNYTAPKKVKPARMLCVVYCFKEPLLIYDSMFMHNNVFIVMPPPKKGDDVIICVCLLIKLQYSES